jgi:hypothetical protein
LSDLSVFTVTGALLLVLPGVSNTDGFVSPFLTESVVHSTNLLEPSFVDLGKSFYDLLVHLHLEKYVASFYKSIYSSSNSFFLLPR